MMPMLMGSVANGLIGSVGKLFGLGRRRKHGRGIGGASASSVYGGLSGIGSHKRGRGSIGGTGRRRRHKR